MARVVSALRPLAVEECEPGRVVVSGDPLQCVLGAVRLRDALSATGSRPWVQLGGDRGQGEPQGIGVVAVRESECIPLRASQWVPVQEGWVLVPDDLGACAEDVLEACLAQGRTRPFTTLRAAMCRPSEPGWIGLCMVRHWAGAAGLPVVEVAPPVRVRDELVVQPRSKRDGVGLLTELSRAAASRPGLDPPVLVLCETRAHLPAEALDLLAAGEATGALWVVEGASDRVSGELPVEDALLVALVGALGPDASLVALRAALPQHEGVERLVAVAVENGLLLQQANGGLRVRSEMLLAPAWGLTSERAFTALGRWAEHRGDRPGTLLALARAQGAAEWEVTVRWMERAIALGDWQGVLHIARSSMVGEQVLPGGGHLVAAAQAEADRSVLQWLRDLLPGSPERLRLALLGVGLAAHPEVGDGPAFAEFLQCVREMDPDDELGDVMVRWRLFSGDVPPTDQIQHDLTLVVLARMHHGRFHGAVADLADVPGTRLDPLGLQHTVHLVLSLGLVAELRRGRREVAGLVRRATRLGRGDGLRVAGVLARWLDALAGKEHRGPPLEIPRGGGARVLSDVLDAESLWAEGLLQEAAAKLSAAAPAGGSGLLEDVACGRAIWLASTIFLEGVLPRQEFERWRVLLRKRAQTSMLAHLRLELAEGLLSAPSGDRHGAARLTGALESAEARGLHCDVRWLREALARHRAISPSDRAVYASTR